MTYHFYIRKDSTDPKVLAVRAPVRLMFLVCKPQNSIQTLAGAHTLFASKETMCMYLQHVVSWI